MNNLSQNLTHRCPRPSDRLPDDSFIVGRSSARDGYSPGFWSRGGQVSAIIASAIPWLLAIPGFRVFLRELVLQGVVDLLGPKSDPKLKADFLALIPELSTTTEEEKRAALVKLKALHHARS